MLKKIQFVFVLFCTLALTSCAQELKVISSYPQTPVVEIVVGRGDIQCIHDSKPMPPIHVHPEHRHRQHRPMVIERRRPYVERRPDIMPRRPEPDRRMREVRPVPEPRREGREFRPKR